MNVEKFNSIEELEILKSYEGSITNDYMNTSLYEANISRLYYIKGEANFYVLIKREGYYKLYYYINDINEKFDAKGTFVSEVVSKEMDETLENMGFELHMTRVRLRLTHKEPYESKRVKYIDDAEFIYEALQSFDEYSGERLDLDEINERIEKKLFIGIDGAGFIEFSTDAFKDAIEHFYIDPAKRGEGLGSEILRHYLGCVSKKKRVNVWTDEGSRAIKLYHKHGFKEDGLKSYVYIWRENQ